MSGTNVFLLNDLIKSITHDGNKHIEHRDISDESDYDKQNPAQVCLWMECESIESKVFILEVTKYRQIDINEGIEDKSLL